MRNSPSRQHAFLSGQLCLTLFSSNHQNEHRCKLLLFLGRFKKGCCANEHLKVWDEQKPVPERGQPHCTPSILMTPGQKASLWKPGGPGPIQCASSLTKRQNKKDPKESEAWKVRKKCKRKESGDEGGEVRANTSEGRRRGKAVERSENRQSSVSQPRKNSSFLPTKSALSSSPLPLQAAPPSITFFAAEWAQMGSLSVKSLPEQLYTPRRIILNFFF